MTYSLLRSVLYMPGSNARAISKARKLPADAIILDLEDAVPPEKKASARETVAAELTAGGFGYRRKFVRANSLSSEWGIQDIQQLNGLDFDALLVPKVDSPDDISAAYQAVVDAELPLHLDLWAMIETPAAIINLHDIARCSEHFPLKGFVLGLNDLAKESGMEQRPGRAAFQPIFTMCVLTARAFNLQLIDGVCNAIDDNDRLKDECEQAKAFGFDGKSLIHPTQIETANTVFAPKEHEINEAQAIVDAFSDPANSGKAALRVNNRMVELLHLSQAKACLEKTRLIAEFTR